MTSFDEYIKSLAKAELVSCPQMFEEHSDTLLRSLRSAVKPRRTVRLRPILRYSIAAILVILLLVGGTYAAYTLSGGAYFKELFASKVRIDSGTNYGYMNTEQLNDMESSTVGNVVDTDALSIDVLGVIVSGNTAEVALKVTAKKLDTMLYDTGIEPLMNYRFHNDTQINLLQALVTGYTQYIYSDKDATLAQNQFIIRYQFTSEQSFSKETYTMEFEDFGYFSFDEQDQFVQLYTGKWVFDIALDPANDTSKTVSIDQELSAGNYSFTIDSVCITPLTCTVTISNSKSFYDRLDDRWQDVWKTLYDKALDLSVNLADGTRLDSSHYQSNGVSGGAPGYEIVATFNVPITVNHAVSITVGGIEIPLQ